MMIFVNTLLANGGEVCYNRGRKLTLGRRQREMLFKASLLANYFIQARLSQPVVTGETVLRRSPLVATEPLIK
jgi:hypothetical protein